MKIVCGIWVAFAAAISPASAQTTAPVNRSITALSETRTVAFQNVLLNPDCSVSSQIAIKVRKEPKNGKLEVEEEGGFPTYPASNPRFACNRRQVPFTKVFYTSNPDFAGTDAAELEVFYTGTGTTSKVNVKIQVRK